MPIEYRFGAVEDIVDNATVVETLINTPDGEEQLSIINNSSVEATWLNFNSNRRTAPDVRRNDNVIIWRLGDTDKYYWSDMNTSNVKRLETVVYAWSADPNNPMKDDLSNAYFLEVSTHNKTITLQTSQANGEPFGYTLQLNTDEGIFVLKDTDENEIYLNSAETIIGFINANLTELRLDKKNIIAYAPDSITMTAVNNINLNCKDLVVKASNSVSVETKATSIKSSATIALETSALTMAGDTIAMEAKSIALAAPAVKLDAAVVDATGIINCEVINAKLGKFVKHS